MIKQKGRPWDAKPATEKSRPVYTVEMERDGRYKVVESPPNATQHDSNFASDGDAEAWAAYVRDWAVYRRKRVDRA